MHLRIRDGTGMGRVIGRIKLQDSAESSGSPKALTEGLGNVSLEVKPTQQIIHIRLGR